jgi:anti-anti-sigma factor
MEAGSIVDIVERDNHAVLYPRGYLNGPLGEKIDSMCADLIHKGKNRILINFSQTETMNTMGVASLVSILEKVARRKGEICFSNVLSTNRQILDVLDISRAVLIFESEEDASRHFQATM